MRFDSKGVQIQKGARKHRISFKQEIEEVYLVENWKKYNQDEEDEDDKCACTLV